MFTHILILILLPLTFLTIVVRALFSPAELAERGVYLEDSWNSPSATPAVFNNQPSPAQKINSERPAIHMTKSQMDGCAAI